MYCKNDGLSLKIVLQCCYSITNQRHLAIQMLNPNIFRRSSKHDVDIISEQYANVLNSVNIYFKNSIGKTYT